LVTGGMIVAERLIGLARKIDQQQSMIVPVEF
jgi:hypothetical protein